MTQLSTFLKKCFISIFVSILLLLLLLLLLLRSLYILSVLRITAVFISRHLGPVIPTSAILKKGSPQQVTHLPPVWDLLLALA
jgi:hypothetical protein